MTPTTIIRRLKGWKDDHPAVDTMQLGIYAKASLPQLECMHSIILVVQSLGRPPQRGHEYRDTTVYQTNIPEPSAFQIIFDT
jgi:hypothetical protein